MKLETMALAFLAATAIGGIAWVFLYPLLSGERNAEKRRASIARTEPVRASVDRTQRSRRQQVESSLKEIEERNKKEKKRPLNARIAQAGLSWSKRKFIIISCVIGFLFFAFTLMFGGNLLTACALAFVGGFGVPRWLLNYLKKRREKKFIAALPDAVDVIVRGIKAGLPLFESLKVVAADAPQPLRGEFLAIIETQTIGIPLGEACSRL
jgi:tight adherence protein B